MNPEEFVKHLLRGTMRPENVREVPIGQIRYPETCLRVKKTFAARAALDRATREFELAATKAEAAKREFDLFKDDMWEAVSKEVRIDQVDELGNTIAYSVNPDSMVVSKLLPREVDTPNHDEMN